MKLAYTPVLISNNDRDIKQKGAQRGSFFTYIEIINIYIIKSINLNFDIFFTRLHAGLLNVRKIN